VAYSTDVSIQVEEEIGYADEYQIRREGQGLIYSAE